MTSTHAPDTARDAGPDPARAGFRAVLPSAAVLIGGMWASAVLVVFVGLAQLDGLVGQVVDDQGRTFSLTGLTGPSSVVGREGTVTGWTAFEAAVGAACSRESACTIPTWVRDYALIDLAFIGLYAAGAAGLLWRLRGRPRVGRGWLVASGLGLLVGAGADAVESVLLLGVLDGGRSGALATASAVKWAGLVLALVAALVAARQATGGGPGQGSDGGREPGDAEPEVGEPIVRDRGVLRRVAAALYTHRFSLFVVVPFAALGLASGSDILDQLPDVQRRWVGHAPEARLFWSGLFTVVVATVVTVVGRLRSHHVHRRVLPGVAPYDVPALLPWFVTAAVVGAGALLASALVGRDGVIGVRFWVAFLVPALVWFSSWCWRRRRGAARSPRRRAVTARQAATTSTVGDVVGILVLALPGVGLVRAFAAPVALGEGGWNRGLLWVGVVVAIGAWPFGRLVGWLGSRLLPPWVLTALIPGAVLDGPETRRGRQVGWALLVGGIAFFLLLGLWPREFVELFGVIEVILLGVTAISLPLGATVILLQAGGAPDVLSRRGSLLLRTAPVTSVLVVTAVVVGTTGSDARIHGLRILDPEGGTSTVAARPSLDERLRTMAGDPGCGAFVSGSPYRARPVFLLAAEGGGIRAAAWTALGADALAEAGGPCAQALMSSGASGGAVGLTVAAFDESERSSFEAVRSISGPDALGAAVTGLLVRDPVRSVTGIPFPVGGEDGWVDRAGLIEREWEQGVGGLRDPFLPGRTDRVTGPLVLNSTSVSTHCRTLLSQLRLDAEPEARTCQTPTSPTASVDLLATLRTPCGAQVPALRAGTVGLLASRFPYVTPSGVVTTGCPSGSEDPDTQQIVDGGYADNDGLGTVVDLSAQWLPTLQAHNAEVVRRVGAGESGADVAPLLVPVLLYLDNGTGSDVATAPAQATNEVLVPLVTKNAATAALSSTDSQLHRALQLFSVRSVVPACAVPPGQDPTDPPFGCEALERWRGPAAKVFYQPTRPSVAAPLGWVLSEHSLLTLQCARDGQVGTALGPLVTDVACGGTTVVEDEVRLSGTLLDAKGYGTMLEALRLARAAAAAEPVAWSSTATP